MCESNLTQYLSEVTVYVSPMVYVIRSRENIFQHTKLHHCSYISLLNLQHILPVLPAPRLITFSLLPAPFLILGHAPCSRGSRGAILPAPLLPLTGVQKN